MKLAAVFLFVVVTQSASILAASETRKSAILLLPDVITIGGEFEAIVECRWDEATPVILDIWEMNGRVSTLGELSVFDEDGKEVPMEFPVSMPPAPTGTKEIRKGELMKIALLRMGIVRFPRSGFYYATAEFSWATSGGRKVLFTTKKCWFHVIDAKPKSA
jgi:hypothetical protein